LFVNKKLIKAIKKNSNNAELLPIIQNAFQQFLDEKIVNIWYKRYKKQKEKLIPVEFSSKKVKDSLEKIR
jgi:hypothetical protein